MRVLDFMLFDKLFKSALFDRLLEVQLKVILPRYVSFVLREQVYCGGIQYT